MCAGLAQCGFPPDTNNVLASNRLWRMSKSEWLRTVRECFETPDRSHLTRATVAFDFRQVAGSLDIVPELVSIMRQTPRHPDFVRALARTAAGYRPPLGFRGTIVPAKDKEAPDGTIDIKRGGMLPVVNIARFYALSSQVTISATLDRLVAVEDLGVLKHEEATALAEAFSVAWRVRLEHQGEQVSTGVAPDNYVNPDRLPVLTRSLLREALRTIAQAQERLSVYLRPGIG
ncbi:MAG: hypothetical protein C4306_11245 [Thermoleophilia bacterium]